MFRRIGITDRVRHGCYQIRAAQDERQAHEVRRFENGPPVKPRFRQVFLKHFLAASVGSHHGVAAGEELLERERMCGKRVTASHQADESMREEPLLKEVRPTQIREIPQRQIDAAVQAVRDVSALIAEIDTAASEQSIGISQVKQALDHIEELTQQNTSLVSYLARSANTLASNADTVAGTMAMFRT